MLHALILGAVQGLTEFIPVSSSGHLVMVPYVLGWEDSLGTDVTFQVAIHLGTLLAIIVYFWPDLWGMVRGVTRIASGRGTETDRGSARLAAMLVVGSVPAAAIGFFLKDPLSETFEHPEHVPWQLLLSAALLIGADAMYRRRSAGRRDVETVGWQDALVIGAFQALAIVPGISRSGSTIAAGVARGLTRDAAARFSFLLGLPAIAGAAALLLPEWERSIPISWILWATVVAAVTGLAAIAFLVRFLKTRPLRPFAYYCVIAAAVGWFFVLFVR
jgi:undecaprenyl-diphosphatase